MNRIAQFAAVAGLVLLSGCNSNTETGNDKEGQLDAAPVPAPRMRAAQALSGIATGAVQLETMTDADIANLGGAGRGTCLMRLTAVGFPSFIYDTAQRTGVIKLNGKLIPLPAISSGVFEDGGLRVVLRPVDRTFGSDGRREADLIVMLSGARDELGYRGYEQCRERRSV